MNRSNVALQRAPDPDTLRQLARRDHEGPFFRVHKRRHAQDDGCWWFAGSTPQKPPGGRFDLPEPRGTLYLAETPLAAAREIYGRYLASGVPVPVTSVADRLVSRIQGRLCDLGDLTDKDALKVGVTHEINTLNDYEVTASWAIAAFRAGFRGLCYYLRFSPNISMAIAYFGEAGPHKPVGLECSASQPLAKVLHDEGVTVCDLPSSEDAVDDTQDVDTL